MSLNILPVSRPSPTATGGSRYSPRHDSGLVEDGGWRKKVFWTIGIGP